MRRTTKNGHIKRNTTKNDLPKLLLECRVDRRLSQADVAKGSGVSQACVSYTERGIRTPSRRNRELLARFLRRHGYRPGVMA